LLLLRYEAVDLHYWLAGVQYIDCLKDDAAGFKQLQAALMSDKSSQSIASIIPQKKAAGKIGKTQIGNRSTMLQKVQGYWVEGVLYPAIGEQGVLFIGIATAGRVVLKHRDYGDYEFPKDSLKIKQVFEDLQCELLILGAPG
jgi:hypothetical protein